MVDDFNSRNLEFSGNRVVASKKKSIRLNIEVNDRGVFHGKISLGSFLNKKTFPVIGFFYKKGRKFHMVLGHSLRKGHHKANVFYHLDQSSHIFEGYYGLAPGSYDFVDFLPKTFIKGETFDKLKHFCHQINSDACLGKIELRMSYV